MKAAMCAVVALGLVLSGCSLDSREQLRSLDAYIDQHARQRAAQPVARVDFAQAGTTFRAATVRERTSVIPGQSSSPRSASADPRAEPDGRFRLASMRPGGLAQQASASAPADDFALMLFQDQSEAEETSGAGESRGPLPSFWDTVSRDLHSLPEDLWSDTKGVYTSVPNLVILGLTYGGSLALQESGPDDSIEHSLRHKNILSGPASDFFSSAGSPITHFGLAGIWYLVGQQRQDDKTYEVGRTLFSALIINGLTTMAGQVATYEDAPNGEPLTFPSGHTSSSFTFASVMHEAYGPWVGVPLYALSAMVAVERLDDQEHYFSDVIMGGVMGLVIGHSVASEHDLEIFGGKIVPYADPYTGSSGIAWHVQF